MPRFGFLSTYPPTHCGLATFTEALSAALPDPDGREARVVRVMDEGSPPAEAPFGRRAIVTELVAGDADSRARAIRALNAFDIVIVQHEYGIFGGPDGEEVLPVLEGMTAPSIVVLHTVLETPSPNQRAVLERIGELATSLIVMSDQAMDNLAAHYRIPLEKVRMIPHGVPESSFDAGAGGSGHRVLTWGLIGPGKGIERGIRAMAGLSDLLPRPEYLIAGKTHPKVLAHQGEAYRDGLVALTRELGVENQVTFLDDYLDAEQLTNLLASADIVLLPYDTRDQVTSGVLVEAVAAGKPVIATRFPHAVELLADGAGIIVDQDDPTAIADAIRSILGEGGRAERMSAAAARASLGSSWTDVAQEYRALAESILAVHAA